MIHVSKNILWTNISIFSNLISQITYCMTHDLEIEKSNCLSHGGTRCWMSASSCGSTFYRMNSEPCSGILQFVNQFLGSHFENEIFFQVLVFEEIRMSFATSQQSTTESWGGMWGHRFLRVTKSPYTCVTIRKCFKRLLLVYKR